MAGKTPKLSAIDAAVKVLTDAGKPMQVPEIIKQAVPLTKLSGKTPGQTIYSVLYAEAKKAKGKARVARTGKGTFKAVTVKAETPKAAKPAASRAKKTTTPEAAAATA